MKHIFTWLKNHLWVAVIGVVIIASVGGFFIYKKMHTALAAPVYAVVDTVSKGSVSSGISATGQIVAAQKLSLDVYKQAQRIDAVNVVNGGHVNAGDVLLSFDKSGAAVSVKSSQLQLAQAKLDLSKQQASYTDPNTTVNTLQNDIVQLQTAIVQAEKDKVQAQRDFNNANTTAESHNYNTRDKTKPTVSGVYSGNTQGSYVVTIYSSASPSGFSFSLSGLETGAQAIYSNTAVPLGSYGLLITFPVGIQSGDQWIIALPNTYAPEYPENKDAFDKSITNLDQTITADKLSIANKQQQIKDAQLSDSTSYRDLDVSKAEAAVSQAQVQLSNNYDVMQEQNIVAPFSGTIDGLANVVVGATPTKNTNDSVSLGTLISDDFLVTFSLNAVDVAKVSVGQKVQVSITSFPVQQPLDAAVTEISALPDSSSVAQYTVKAKITIPKDSGISLREGLLANVEIVQQEVNDVLRIPISAVTYTNGKSTVEVVNDTLTSEEQTQLDKLHILKSDSGTFPSYPVAVKLGVAGTFYAEVTDGLQEGQKIIVSKTEQAVQVLQQRGTFGAGARVTTGGTGEARGFGGAAASGNAGASTNRAGGGG